MRMGRVPGHGALGEGMRQRWRSVWIGCGAALAIAGLPTGAPAAELPQALFCDEYNPFAPARTGEIAFDSSDFADADGTVILGFIETASIGKVEVESVRASPARIVRTVSAVPDISMLSPHFGERLKGIRIAVTLEKARQPVRIVLKLRQVCARHFRNTFLYY
jgi:hypothetical protein